jgi:predicted secreted protein
MSKTKFGVTVLTIYLLLLLIPTVAYAATNTVANEMSNGSTITLHKEDTITLTFNENPSTGYVWKLKTTPGLLIIIDKILPPKTPGPGIPGHQMWVIKAIDTGNQQIKGEYQRLWETQSVETFILNVNVLPESLFSCITI